MGIEQVDTGTPHLSLVIPIYQVEDYLRKCLESVLADSTLAIEVIAVDDCSPDASSTILAEFARNNPRLRVIRMPTNSGVGLARNAGLDRATGEYVWFIDGDDWLPPGAVRAVSERLATTRPDVLLIGHDEVLGDGTPVVRDGMEPLHGVSAPIRLADRPELLRQAQSACIKVARRAFLTKLGLRFRRGWYEDSSFSHPLLMAAESIDVLETVCYHYRQRHLGSITKTRGDRHFEVFDQYRWLFNLVDQAGGAYDAYRPELFRLMINHYLVIVGNPRRLPPELRQAFFERIVEDYRRWRPAGGYPLPEGVTRLKHHLVRFGAYHTYAALRRVKLALADQHRPAPAVTERVGARPTAPESVAPEPVMPPLPMLVQRESR
jgi:glycosyltransferase involved in cell wall biosynthesis